MNETSNANSSPDISIIVPALNEAENIPQLVPRLAKALRDVSWELFIVDDNSPDRTSAVCAELATSYPVRLLVRTEPKHGLGGAVLHGISASNGATIVVMDADLQHPPERVPALVAALDDGADFALGSRYVEGGSTDHEWTFFRKINSDVATFLARPFAGKVRDPMSGFFALRRSTFNRAQRLTPLGYKIALEIMCKCRVQNVREVPIHFGLRTKGESKLNLKEQFRYLEHLSRLYDFSYPRTSPMAKFLIITLSGYVFGFCMFESMFASDRNRIAATVFGYLGTLLVTAVFHARYVRTQREFLVRQHPWRDFFLIAVTELLAIWLSAHWLVHRAGDIPPIEAFSISFGCATLVKYVLRKELLLDLRGLRKDLRREELL